MCQCTSTIYIINDSTTGHVDFHATVNITFLTTTKNISNAGIGRSLYTDGCTAAYSNTCATHNMSNFTTTIDVTYHVAVGYTDRSVTCTISVINITATVASFTHTAAIDATEII